MLAPSITKHNDQTHGDTGSGNGFKQAISMLILSAHGRVLMRLNLRYFKAKQHRWTITM